MSLDSRLLAVATFVEPNAVVADVGTDHGYLISYLVKSGIAKRGYATDINQMPLEMAQRTILELGLENKIETVLCDGLLPLQGKQIDTVALAGVGGELIATMIEQAPWVQDDGISLILQPMSRPEHLRSFLYQNGFSIQKEQAVASGYHVYSVMKVAYTGEIRPITTREAWLGGLLGQRDAVTLSYFSKAQKRLAYQVRSEENNQTVMEMNLLREELERILQYANYP